jgi:uncharacterized protein (TIGR02231 family)
MSHRSPLLTATIHTDRPTHADRGRRLPALACLAAVLLIFAASTRAAADTEANSVITSVTVYRNRAMVERTAVLELSPGRHSFLFSDLPFSIDERSFRVSGRGSVPITILGSDTRRILHKEAVDERVRFLEEKIAKLMAAKGQLLAKLEVIVSQKEFVESVKSTSTELLSKELGLGKIDAKAWEAAFDFVGTSLGQLAGRRLDLEAQAKELDDEIDLLEWELQQLRRSGPNQSYTVAADIDVGSPGGEIRLVLTYLIGGATWMPSYDARFYPEDGLVEMTAYGLVTQNTGEDWTAVDLALSTAEPATEAAPPELFAWYLDLQRPVAMEERPAGAAEKEVRADVMQPPALPTPGGIVMEAPGLQAMSWQLAAIARAGMTETYSVPTKEDVPADGNPVKTAIGKMSFTPKLKHAATPLAVEKVYLTSDIVNDSNYTMLPGRVDVFTGSDMIGSVNLSNPIVPGETFHIAFGADPEVKVKREIIKRETSKSGKDRTRVLESIKITLNNYKKEPVVVTLKDRVPVSRNKEIDVDIDKLEPEPDSVDPSGIAEWNLRIPPGEEMSVLLEYKVTYPTGAWVTGL